MIFSHLHVYDHYGYALFAVVGTFATVWAIYRLMAFSPRAAGIRRLQGVAPPFINIIGVLFGLTLAFLANDTWNAHDRATTAVYREADSLRSILTLAEALEKPAGGRLHEAAVDYGRAVVDEWSYLAQRGVSSDATAKADALLALLVSPEIAREAGGNVQMLMLQRAADLRNDRNLRVSLSQTHINPLKWLGMAFLGLLTLLSVAVVHADNARAALVATLLFALAAAPTAAIVLVQGNPFQVPSVVSPAPIIQAIDERR